MLLYCIVLYSQDLAGETEAGPLSEGASVELCCPVPDRVPPLAMGTLAGQLQRKALHLCFTDGEIETWALSKCMLHLWYHLLVWSPGTVGEPPLM